LSFLQNVVVFAAWIPQRVMKLPDIFRFWLTLMLKIYNIL